MRPSREKKGRGNVKCVRGVGVPGRRKSGECGWVVAQSGPDDAGKRQSNGCRRSQRGARTTQEKEKVPGRDCQGREGAQATRRGDGGMALLLELLRATEIESPIVDLPCRAVGCRRNMHGARVDAARPALTPVHSWPREGPLCQQGTRVIPCECNGSSIGLATGGYKEEGGGVRGNNTDTKVQAKLYVQYIMLQTGHYCASVHTSSGSWHTTLSQSHFHE